MFLPHATYRKETYKCALVVIDIASRYKDAEALVSKESSEVAKAFEKIYSLKLKWPEILMVDPGKDFFRNVTTLMNKHKVKFQRSEAGNYRAQAFGRESESNTRRKNIYSVRTGNGRRPNE